MLDLLSESSLPLPVLLPLPLLLLQGGVQHVQDLGKLGRDFLLAVCCLEMAEDLRGCGSARRDLHEVLLRIVHLGNGVLHDVDLVLDNDWRVLDDVISC